MPSQLELAMSQHFLDEIIRYEKDKFTTPNIYGVDENGNLQISCKQFRLKNMDTELFFFVEYQHQLYLPIWFEFRSINNNLLYLIEEYKIDSFHVLQNILNSSLKKEERWTAEMKAVVYKCKNAPSFCHYLENFKIEPEYLIELEEK